jgi:hypothetical protein
VPYGTAALLAGISGTAAKEWLQRGEGTHPTRKPTQAFAAFAAAIARARAQDEARRVARINQAGQGGTVLSSKTVESVDPATGKVTKRVIEEHRAPPDWRADAFHLERSRPKEWGRKDQVEVTHFIRSKAERLAKKLGMTVEEVMAEAEAYARGES